MVGDGEAVEEAGADDAIADVPLALTRAEADCSSVTELVIVGVAVVLAAKVALAKTVPVWVGVLDEHVVGVPVGVAVSVRLTDGVREADRVSDGVTVGVAVVVTDKVTLAKAVPVCVCVLDEQAVGVLVAVVVSVTLTDCVPEPDVESDIVAVGVTVAVADAVGDEHATLPGDEYWPAPHTPLQFADDSPAVSPYKPALQLLHAAAPVSEY